MLVPYRNSKLVNGRHSVGDHRSVTNAVPKLCTRYCPRPFISTLAWRLKDCDRLLLIFVHLALNYDLACIKLFIYLFIYFSLRNSMLSIGSGSSLKVRSVLCTYLILNF